MLLHPVCEVGGRGFVAFRDELLGGPVGEQRLDFRAILVQLAFTGTFRPSYGQAGGPSHPKGFFRPGGDQSPQVRQLRAIFELLVFGGCCYFNRLAVADGVNFAIFVVTRHDRIHR